MNYKKLIIIPLLLLAISLVYLFYQVSTKGLILDIDLKGGTQIVAESPTSINEQAIENILKKYDVDIRTARGVTGYTIFINFDASINPNDVIKTLKENGYDFKSYSTQTIGPALGVAFFQQAQLALLFAFSFMAVTVFIIFKKIVLSFRVVLSAFADIIETLVLSQILGIELSLATFAALLLLIGYSVDDDILLTNRVIKGSGEIKTRIKGAMKTAFTMVGATCVALLALLIMSSSLVIVEIASILLMGLIFDQINTWLFNAPVLRWYVEGLNET